MNELNAGLVSRKILEFSGAAGICAALVLWLIGWNSEAQYAVVVSMLLAAIMTRTSSRIKNLSFTVWVFVFAGTAFLYPDIFISWGGFEPKRLIVPLIQLTLFGMGMTLHVEDFARVLKMPRAVLSGIVLQYSIMPFMGLFFALCFNLSPELATGLVLVGSCPGGVASNVIAYLAKANVALSVTMTACSTLLSPLITPVAMKFLAGQFVPIQVFPMMMSILKMIIIPLVIGIVVNHYIHKGAAWLLRWLPFIAMLSICLIIGITIALSRNEFLVAGAALFGASFCHNAVGLVLGYWLGRAGGLDERDSRTIAIEVGMQNGGMATGLAFDVLKSSNAALASAVFGPWSAITGSVLASWWRRRKLPSQK